MIGLAVYLNGKKLTLAGADDLCVLNAIVNAVGDRITVTLVRTERPDKHTSAHPAGGERQKIDKLLEGSKSRAQPAVGRKGIRRPSK